LNLELGEVIVVTVSVSVAIEVSTEWDEQFIRQWEGVVGSDEVSPSSNVSQSADPSLSFLERQYDLMSLVPPGAAKEKYWNRCKIHSDHRHLVWSWERGTHQWQDHTRSWSLRQSTICFTTLLQVLPVHHPLAT
jgi:hypothetical protein